MVSPTLSSARIPIEHKLNILSSKCIEQSAIHRLNGLIGKSDWKTNDFDDDDDDDDQNDNGDTPWRERVIVSQENPPSGQILVSTIGLFANYLIHV